MTLHVNHTINFCDSRVFRLPTFTVWATDCLKNACWDSENDSVIYKCRPTDSNIARKSS
jgi:hypothetical protein